MTQSAPRFVSYCRVSTDRQGRSGLGLDAQFATVSKFVAERHGSIEAQFIEIESGKRNDRPELAKALIACRSHNATLVIAKLDRLARNARFLLSVVEGVGDRGVAFCDLPSVPAGPVGKFMLTQLAAVAELEAGLIGERTKSALRAAKARGVRLGNPNLPTGNGATAALASRARSIRANELAQDVLPYIDAARTAGASSLRQIASALTARGVRTPRGGNGWTAAQVSRVIARAVAEGGGRKNHEHPSRAHARVKHRSAKQLTGKT